MVSRPGWSGLWCLWCPLVRTWVARAARAGNSGRCLVARLRVSGRTTAYTPSLYRVDALDRVAKARIHEHIARTRTIRSGLRSCGLCG
eukprot:4849951-Pyramimonas_sp.AAC.1